MDASVSTQTHSVFRVSEMLLKKQLNSAWASVNIKLDLISVFISVNKTLDFLISIIEYFSKYQKDVNNLIAELLFISKVYHSGAGALQDPNATPALTILDEIINRLSSISQVVESIYVILEGYAGCFNEWISTIYQHHARICAARQKDRN